MYSREELEREIARLPEGCVVRKKIKGKEYYYHRLRIDGKYKDFYVDFSSVDNLRKDIGRRRELEKQLRENIQTKASCFTIREPESPYFTSSVRIGEELDSFCKPAGSLKRRSCYVKLERYIHDETDAKVLILYGLRRTGKTTLIRQCIEALTPEERRKSAYIMPLSSSTLASLNRDLKTLEYNGFRYIFIDEVTALSDFIEGAALFSDIYASSGMKIVLSGTDSLGFAFAESDQLYDRALLIHTTFIPYHEFQEILGIHGIDEYMRYGGTMSLGGSHYNEDSPFASKSSADEYIDSAIARNIQHSLAHYQDGSHFRGLEELHERNELTGAINRVVEDMNHRFTKEVLTRTFHSGDLAITARNLLHDRTRPTDPEKAIDYEIVEKTLKEMLEILDREEQTIAIEDSHAAEIREYMQILDLIEEVDVMHLPKTGTAGRRVLISQPGIRYAEAEALVESIMKDRIFSNLSIVERNMIISRILSEIRGRMMEDQVLLETKLAYPEKHVFTLQFAIGEFDMVIADPKTLTCSICEIKHSTERNDAQFRHLRDDGKCRMTEHAFGRIEKRLVIYRGDAFGKDDIEYVNVEEYLKQLPR